MTDNLLVRNIMVDLMNGANKTISSTFAMSDLQLAFPKELRERVEEISQFTRLGDETSYGFGTIGDPESDKYFNVVLQELVQDFRKLFSQDAEDSLTYMYRTYVQLCNNISDAAHSIDPFRGLTAG